MRYDYPPWGLSPGDELIYAAIAPREDIRRMFHKAWLLGKHQHKMIQRYLEMIGLPENASVTDYLDGIKQLENTERLRDEALCRLLAFISGKSAVEAQEFYQMSSGHGLA